MTVPIAAADVLPMVRRLLPSGLLTGVVDGLFSSVLSVAFYDSTVTRLFQGVASTVLGRAALDGGARTAAIGVAMHFGVALGWSTVFLTLLLLSSRLRGVLASPRGALRMAVWFGPLVWLVMSMVIVPFLLNRPSAITIRWWVQLVGHIPFVALPMAWVFRGALRATPAPAHVARVLKTGT